jgi:hypothetical protein
VNGLLELGLDLPVLMADDDFIEYLQEEGYADTIELKDLYVEYCYWEKENVGE